MQNKNYRKLIRLKNFNYTGKYCYFLTLCTFNKKNIFNSPDITQKMIELLKNHSIMHKFKVWIYCFMPDHLHLLAEGIDNSAGLKKFIKLYKQNTGFYYKKYTKNRLWQTSYHEHILRKDEDVKKTIFYILNNPVRKKLTNEYLEYKYSGSFVFDIREIGF